MIDVLMDKLININFRKNYFGYRIVPSISEEDERFINDNEFIFVVTDKTKNYGYQGDKDLVAEHLEIDKEYTLKSMIVSQSSTSIILKEFPRMSFNSVNFVVKECRPKDNL